MPNSEHEAPVMAVLRAFNDWSDSLTPEDAKRIQWGFTTSHRRVLDKNRPEELQPDGSIQCSMNGFREEVKHLMFVMEIANSQSLLEVRGKIGKWLVGHQVRTGMIVKVDLEVHDEGADSLNISFEVWRAREVNDKLFEELGLEGQPTTKGSNVLYNEEKGVLWIAAEGAEGGKVVFAKMFQSGGPYSIVNVRYHFIDMNTVFSSSRSRLRPTL
jgi:hypothetical protein